MHAAADDYDDDDDIDVVIAIAIISVATVMMMKTQQSLGVIMFTIKRIE